MAISKGRKVICIEDILNKVTEYSILAYYLNISKIPCVINSPLREDNHPSLGLYISEKRIKYYDFASQERGDIYNLLGNWWNCSYRKVLETIYRDIDKIPHVTSESYTKGIKRNVKYSPSINTTTMGCKVREWEDYDIEFWSSFGIPKKWLIYAEVHPISHKIITKEDRTYTFKADKYAYAYVERKEGNITLKIYQPLNKKGFKWSSKHDRSVISLWTKIPEYGDRLCICSSLKDALCLWANTGIPALAIQGEGYGISNTAINELKRRYKNIYILLDNDKTGLRDGIKLAESTGFTNIVLPQLPEYDNPKDIADLYKAVNNKKTFTKIILNLF